MRSVLTAVLILTVVLAPAGIALAGPSAHLILQSEPGDPIGGGGTFDLTYTPENSTFFAAEALLLIGPSPSALFFGLGSITPDNTSLSMFFETAGLGIPIEPGFYPDATRAFASPDHPGFSIGFRNVGCGSLTGEFTIDHLTFSAGPTIETFGVRFEQHCDGIEPALFGTFEYAASTDVRVAAPPTLALLGSALAGLLGAAAAWTRLPRR
jgi:hypothetical protein